MSDVNEGPVEPAVETDSDTTTMSPGFGALVDVMEKEDPPAQDAEGQPKETEAVDKSEAEETAEPESETKADAKSKDDAEEGSEDGDEQTEADQTVNFDGFSEQTKATWERLLKAGHATPEEVETARIESMFQSSYTKKTMALADDRKAFKAEMDERKADLEILDKIRGSDRLHAIWMRMQDDSVSDEPSDDDLVTRRQAQEEADKRYEKREQEKRERSAKQQAEYESKQVEIHDVVVESMKMLGADKAMMKAILDAEEATLPVGTDPVLHFTPEKLQRAIQRRHKVLTLEAKVAQLEAANTKKTSNAARTAKQSLPPAPRVAGGARKSALQKTEEDLGIDRDWSNVQGFGGHGGVS